MPSLKIRESFPRNFQTGNGKIQPLSSVVNYCGLEAMGSHEPSPGNKLVNSKRKAKQKEIKERDEEVLASFKISNNELEK